MQAPHQPTVKHPLDTQNFENFDEQAPGGLNPSGMKRWARADPNFVGYTYKNWEAVQPGAHDGKSLSLSTPCLAREVLHYVFVCQFWSCNAWGSACPELMTQGYMF